MTPSSHVPLTSQIPLSLVTPERLNRDPLWWSWAIMALLVLGGLCLRLAWGGFPVQTDYPFATAILLDGGSRMLAGQVPYHDFHTPIGFTYLGLVAGFLALADGLPHGLALLSATAGAVIGAWAWYVSSIRYPLHLAATASVTVGLMAASPAMFGYGPLNVTYGGHYSRLAWSILAVVILQAAALPAHRPPGRARACAEGLGLGTCLGLLIGIKFTFLFAALFVVACGWFHRCPDRRFVMAILFGVIVTVAVGLVASRASLGDYLADCARVGGSVSLIDLLWSYRRKADLLTLGLLGAVAIWTWPSLSAGWKPAWRRPFPEAHLLAIVVLGIGLVLSASSGIEDASPSGLLALLPLIGGHFHGPDGMRIRLGAVLIATAMFAAFGLRLAMPILKGPYASESTYAALSEGPWRGLDFLPAVKGTDTAEGLVPQVWIQPRTLVCNAWFLYLREGEALLRGRVAPEDRVLCMDYINPFPYLLGHQAPRGDNLYWSFNRNVSAANAPQAALLFADAEWVMVPKRGLYRRSVEDKLEIYQSWIEQNYQLDSSNAWWNCFRRERPSVEPRSSLP